MFHMLLTVWLHNLLRIMSVTEERDVLLKNCYRLIVNGSLQQHITLTDSAPFDHICRGKTVVWNTSFMQRWTPFWLCAIDDFVSIGVLKVFHSSSLDWIAFSSRFHILSHLTPAKMCSVRSKHPRPRQICLPVQRSSGQLLMEISGASINNPLEMESWNKPAARANSSCGQTKLGEPRTDRNCRLGCILVVKKDFIVSMHLTWQ